MLQYVRDDPLGIYVKNYSINLGKNPAIFFAADNGKATLVK
jgi:hypothetical protein